MDPYVLEQSTSDDRVGDRAFLPKIAKGLRRAGHMVAFIPFMNVIGGFGVAAGYVAEVADSLFNGKFTKAIKQAVMGAADVSVTTFTGGMLKGVFEAAQVGGLAATAFVPGLLTWAADPISLIATGKSTGELARAATGTLLDAPEAMAEKAKRAEYKNSLQHMPFAAGRGHVTGYAPAQVGWAPGMQQQMTAAPAAPQDRYWFDRMAQERGADPELAYKNYQQGNIEHLAALEEARSRAPSEQQLA